VLQPPMRLTKNKKQPMLSWNGNWGCRAGADAGVYGQLTL